MPQESITTAVDSLVKFVKESKKVSLTEASTKLNIPEAILSEWASFLEQEGILEIEYKFTTPFLISKDANKLQKEEITDYNNKLKECLDFIGKQKIKAKCKIKDEEDIKKIVNKGKDADICDILFAQKIYLEKAVKKAIELLKKNEITRDDLEDLLKKYEIFRKKAREVKV